jgi:hypothetical protein
MKASEKRYQHWVRHFLTSLISIAFIGFFTLVWQVHAFDVQKQLPEVDDKASAEQVADQVLSVRTAEASSPARASSRPDQWSDGDVVSALSSFYQTIITLMGLLLGVIGILAVLTLRFLSKSAAEDIAHESAKEAMRHYLETRQFGENIEFALQETGLANQLEKLAGEIESIKRLLRDKNHAAVDEERVEGDVVSLNDRE